MDLVALSFVASMWDLQAWSNANDCACRYYIVYQCNSTIFHSYSIYTPLYTITLSMVVICCDHPLQSNQLAEMPQWLGYFTMFLHFGLIRHHMWETTPGNLTQLYIEHGQFVDYLPIKMVIWHSRLSVYQRVTIFMDDMRVTPDDWLAALGVDGMLSLSILPTSKNLSNSTA